MSQVLINEKLEKLVRKENLFELIERLLSDLEKLIRCLEIYLCLCLDSIQPVKRLSKIQAIGSIDAVLSFNYTDTFEWFYQSGQLKMPEYCYIHGRARSKDTKEFNNMVLGIDEYLDTTERNRQVGAPHQSGQGPA